MGEVFGIAAFRSRQQVLRLDATLKAMGIATQIVNTPRAIAAGCGLSSRFAESDLARVSQILRQYHFGALVGLYRVDTRSGKPVLSVY